jgi:hypothetical protein
MVTPYALERLIESYLTEKLDSSILILRAANLHGIPRQFNQSVYIIPQTLQVDEQRRGQVRLMETVYVVSVVRNAATQLSSADSRDDAGSLLSSIITNLLGWVPADGYERLEMGTGPVPEFDAGFGYYPLSFYSRYVLTGATT